MAKDVFYQCIRVKANSDHELSPFVNGESELYVITYEYPIFKATMVAWSLASEFFELNGPMEFKQGIM